jgi:hypothetical protein
MAQRLTEKRKQPELVNDQMKNWLLFLRNQANELEIPVIDTSNLSEGDVLSVYEKLFKISDYVNKQIGQDH